MHWLLFKYLKYGLAISSQSANWGGKPAIMLIEFDTLDSALPNDIVSERTAVPESSSRSFGNTVLGDLLTSFLEILGAEAVTEHKSAPTQTISKEMRV